MAKPRQTDVIKTKLKKQITSKETVKSAKLVLTILFVVLTALFSFARTLNSYIPKWLHIPTWPQIYELVGLHLEEYIEIPDAPLVVSFIDVGQGDCTFIKTKEADILIDAGEAESAEAVIEYLNLYNVDDLEYIIATHPHSDHVGALPEIMEEIPAEVLVILQESALTYDGDEYRQNLIQTAQNAGMRVRELSFDSIEESIFIGEVALEFLGPTVDDDNLNNLSLVVRMTFGEVSFLFTGDAEALEEYTILSRAYEQKTNMEETKETTKEFEQSTYGEWVSLDCDVLKVAHHGSDTSSTTDFIKAVSPQHAVISSGVDNPYGHPHSETLLTLTEAGCTIWKTATCGHIVFAVNEEGKIRVLTQLFEGESY